MTTLWYVIYRYRVIANWLDHERVEFYLRVYFNNYSLLSLTPTPTITWDKEEKNLCKNKTRWVCGPTSYRARGTNFKLIPWNNYNTALQG